MPNTSNTEVNKINSASPLIELMVKKKRHILKTTNKKYLIGMPL